MDNTFIFSALIILVASFVRAVSGFGQALIAAPLLTFVIETKSVVVINVFLAGIGTVIVLFYTWRHIDLRRVLFIGLGGVLGVPLGAYLLVSLDPAIIKLAIALLVIISSVLLLLGYSHQFKRDTLGCVVAGFLSGVIGGSTSLGGPPVVLFLLNQGLVKERFVGTLAAYFLFISVITISAFSTLDMITIDLLINVAILVPPLWLGTYVGSKLLPRVNPLLFKRIASYILSVTALVIIVTVLIEL